MASFQDLKKLPGNVWELPKSGDMNVPARIIANETIAKGMDQGVYDQLVNVACMPGIQRAAYAMADAHWGYGFPVGGVAAFDAKEGVISPGGIGFDINCGMRLVNTNLTYKEVKPKLKELVDLLFKTVPVGVGASGIVKLNKEQFKEVMVHGAKWCVEKGYGWKEDVDRIEDFGAIEGANPAMVSQKALDRGRDQLGTLGSGNHYLEIQTVNMIDNEKVATQLGITQKDQVMIMFHCGSRGFGHQICTDYVKVFQDAMQRYNINVKDPELACAPFSSPEGEDYYSAMACAANMAFANRQVILHRIREAFQQVFKKDAEELGLHMIYDVAHNIAKVEEYKSGSKSKKFIVHRKGATRSFGPGRKELAPIYRKLGQPVIIGGSMETGSYLLLGTKKAEEETFGSTAHGSGRLMSRTQAQKQWQGEKLAKDMEKRGIYIRTASFQGLAEEAGGAYKNISDVIQSVHDAGISEKIVKLTPIGNVKG